jgi:acyl-CoA synthetase (AMP-forming)/AMP-acid ligase II
MTIIGGGLVTSGTSRTASSREVFGRSLFDPMESADGPAILGPETISYPDLLRRVDRLGSRLRKAGVREETRVGICLEPTPSYVIALLAVLRMGAKVVLLSPGWAAEEVRRCVTTTQPAFLIADHAPQGLEPACPVSPLEESALMLVDLGAEGLDPSAPSDAVLIFTSGTSGIPKGVVLSASGLLANVTAIREYLAVERMDSALLFTPTCYAYAVSQVLVQALASAAICPVNKGLKYPILLLEAISKFRIRGVSANPTSFKILLGTQTSSSVDLSSLRYAQSGGQFLSPELVEGIRMRFSNSRVVNQYGCTENSPRICYHWVRDGEQPLPGCSLPVGKGVRGTEILLADEAGRRVPAGDTGQILVRGTSLMSGYWKMPEQTASRFVDGWFATGDLGRLDPAGNLIVVGRLTDVINIGNEKVTPGEVEAFIQQLASVDEAAVFGVADPLFGEAVEAIVVVRPNTAADEETVTREIRAHLRGLVSPFKIPRRVHFRANLPRTLYGKLDRKRLAEWAKGD